MGDERQIPALGASDFAGQRHRCCWLQVIRLEAVFINLHLRGKERGICDWQAALAYFFVHLIHFATYNTLRSCDFETVLQRQRHG